MKQVLIVCAVMLIGGCSGMQSSGFGRTGDRATNSDTMSYQTYPGRVFNANDPYHGG